MSSSSPAPRSSTRSELRSLEVLLAVAEHGSIGAASRALGMRQPSVTSRLQHLERHLRLDLVYRTARGSTLTTEGSTVADWAREVLRASDRLESGVAALRGAQDSQLTVSASMTIAEYLMPRWLVALSANSPHTNVSLRMRNSAQVAADITAGSADLGFVETPRVPSGLRSRVFAEDELVAVVGRGHPWRGRDRDPGPADLAQAALIVREQGSGTRDALERALAAAGEEHGESHLELASTAAIKSAVLAGQGVGVLSTLAVADELANGQLYQVPVSGVDLRRELRIVWRAEDTLSTAAGELTEHALRGA